MEKLAKYGTEFIFGIPLATTESEDYETPPTIAAGDFQISKDFGDWANLATPTVSPAGSEQVKVVVSAAQMQCKQANIRIKDQGTKEWQPDWITIATVGHASAQHPNIGETMRGTDNAALETTLLTSLQDIITVMESHRGHHTHSGNHFYWNPINGDDSKDGLTKATAKLTYDFADVNGGIHGLLTDSNHDLITILPGAAGGPTEINEYIELDTRYTFLRAMGRDIFVNATHNEGSAILLSKEGCELSGVRVHTKVTGSQDAICATADFAWIHNVWVDYSRGNGIHIHNASNCIIEEYTIQDAAKGGSGHAVHVEGDISITTRNFIKNGKMLSNGNGGETDGIRFTGAYCIHNFVVGSEKGIIAHANTGYGINEIEGANHTICIGPSIHLEHNTLGKYNLTGANSIMENEGQWATETMLTDVRDEALGKWEVDPDNDTLTLYRIDGVTVLKVFDLTSTVELVPQYIDRVPQ